MSGTAGEDIYGLSAEVTVGSGSVGGEKGWAERIEETEEMIQKRKSGQRRAEEREMVRSAAQRVCAFGFAVEEIGGNRNGRTEMTKRRDKNRAPNEDVDERGQTERRRKCEVVMNKVVVEASFANADWGIRWRE